MASPVFSGRTSNFCHGHNYAAIGLLSIDCDTVLANPMDGESFRPLSGSLRRGGTTSHEDGNRSEQEAHNEEASPGHLRRPLLFRRETPARRCPTGRFALGFGSSSALFAPNFDLIKTSWRLARSALSFSTRLSRHSRRECSCLPSNQTASQCSHVFGSFDTV